MLTNPYNANLEWVQFKSFIPNGAVFDGKELANELAFCNGQFGSSFITRAKIGGLWVTMRKCMKSS